MSSNFDSICKCSSFEVCGTGQDETTLAPVMSTIALNFDPKVEEEKEKVEKTRAAAAQVMAKFQAPVGQARTAPRSIFRKVTLPPSSK